MIKIFSTILLGTIISINLNANENEISSYSILKYQADFSKQTPQLQESITNEYLRVKKIATILQNQEMKNDIDLEVLQAVIDEFEYSGIFPNEMIGESLHAPFLKKISLIDNVKVFIKNLSRKYL